MARPESIPLDPPAPEWPGSQPARQVQDNTDRDTTAELILLKVIQERQQRLEEAIHLPRADLMTFNGDPMQFWVFIKSFEHNVDNTNLDENAKLTHLRHYCTGKARQVIECWFGNNHIIAEAWLEKVTNGPSIGGKQALIDFAYDL